MSHPHLHLVMALVPPARLVLLLEVDRNLGPGRVLGRSQAVSHPVGRTVTIAIVKNYNLSYSTFSSPTPASCTASPSSAGSGRLQGED